MPQLFPRGPGGTAGAQDWSGNSAPPGRRQRPAFCGRGSGAEDRGPPRAPAGRSENATQGFRARS